MTAPDAVPTGEDGLPYDDRLIECPECRSVFEAEDHTLDPDTERLLARARETARAEGETYQTLIDAAHHEQRQALAAGRGEETLTLFQHWSATAGWLASRKRAAERTGEPDWPDAMNCAAGGDDA